MQSDGGFSPPQFVYLALSALLMQSGGGVAPSHLVYLPSVAFDLAILKVTRAVTVIARMIAAMIVHSCIFKKERKKSFGRRKHTDMADSKAVCDPIDLHYCEHGKLWDGKKCIQPPKCQKDEYYDFNANACAMMEKGCAPGYVLPGHDRGNLGTTTHCSLLSGDKGKLPDCYDCFLGYGNPGGGEKTYCCGADDYLAGKCAVLNKRSWDGTPTAPKV